MTETIRKIRFWLIRRLAGKDTIVLNAHFIVETPSDYYLCFDKDYKGSALICGNLFLNY
jgi:hypothetical protein